MLSFLRVVGLLLAMVAMGGFAACGAYGVFVSVSMSKGINISDVFLLYGLGGLAIATLLAWFVYRALRRPGALPPPPPGQ